MNPLKMSQDLAFYPSVSQTLLLEV